MGLKIKKASSNWCSPCHALSKILVPLLSDYPNIEFEEIDIEENDDFAVKYSIRSLPTTLIFMDDIELFRFVGTRSKEELKEIIDKYVK